MIFDYVIVFYVIQNCYFVICMVYFFFFNLYGEGFKVVKRVVWFLYLVLVVKGMLNLQLC